MNLDKWFDKILDLHGTECYMLIRFHRGKLQLLAASSQLAELKFITDRELSLENQERPPEYCG